MQVIPASTAAWIVRTASRSSLGPYRSPPIGHVPSPITEVVKDVLPQTRYSIASLRGTLGSRAAGSGVQVVPNAVPEVSNREHDQAQDHARRVEIHQPVLR